MPKKTGSTDPLSSFGLKRGSRKQKKGESRVAFLKRLSGPHACAAMVKAWGSIKVFAQVYDVPHQFVRDAVAYGKIKRDGVEISFLKLADAVKEGEIVKHGRDRANAELKDIVMAKVVAEKGGDETGRQRWPSDPAKRDAEVKKYLLKALVEHEGRKAMVADGGNLPLSSVLAMIRTDPDLQAAEQEGLKCAEARIEEQFLENAIASGNHAAQKSALKNMNSDRWGDKSTVEHTGGFDAPPTKALPSVLPSVLDDDEAEVKAAN